MSLPCTGAGGPASTSARGPPSPGGGLPLSSVVSSPGGGCVASVPESSPPPGLPPLSSPPQPAANIPAAATPPRRTEATPQRIKVILRISTLLAQIDEDCESVS